MFTHFIESCLQFCVEIIESLLCFLDGDVTATDQGLCVKLSNRTLRVDDLIHQWLGVARIIAFVVTMLAVADEVNHHVLVEPLTEAQGEPCGSDAGFRVVAIDVENWRLHHLGNVSWVET